MRKLFAVISCALFLGACNLSWSDLAGKDTVECGSGPAGNTYTFLKGECDSTPPAGNDAVPSAASFR